MYFGTRSSVAIGFTCLACLGPGVHLSEAQQLRVEGFFPRQLPPGQATVIKVWGAMEPIVRLRTRF
jgi:hypothetical protein